MSKVDWENSPSDAEAYINGCFTKWEGGKEFDYSKGRWVSGMGNWPLSRYVDSSDFSVELRPDEWKKGAERMEQIAQNGNDGEVYEDDGQISAYHRKVKGVWIDFYDIAEAFDPQNRNSADDHALKKMLLPGKRHTKGGIQDRREAIKSIERAIEKEQERCE